MAQGELELQKLHPSSHNAAVTAKKRAIHFCFTLALTNLVAYQELLIFLWAFAKIGKLMGKVSEGTLAAKPFSKEKDTWGLRLDSWGRLIFWSFLSFLHHFLL